MTDEKTWLRLVREFDAPIETVWKMWTDPNMFKRWYGPRGMSIPVVEMDVRVGGTRKICMEMASSERSMKMWFSGVYKEVTPPRRLIYTESMCDENGTLISPQMMGMPDDFPDVTEVIVDLVEVAGKTRMTMIHMGVEAGTAAESGWAQAFDKLGEQLASAGNSAD